MQYTMTLSGPKRVQLLGFTDALRSPAVVFMLGLLGGTLLAFRKRR